MLRSIATSCSSLRPARSSSCPCAVVVFAIESGPRVGEVRTADTRAPEAPTPADHRSRSVAGSWSAVQASVSTALEAGTFLHNPSRFETMEDVRTMATTSGRKKATRKTAARKTTARKSAKKSTGVRKVAKRVATGAKNTAKKAASGAKKTAKKAAAGAKKAVTGAKKTVTGARKTAKKAARGARTVGRALETAGDMLVAGAAVVEELTSKARKAGTSVAPRTGRKKTAGRRKASA